MGNHNSPNAFETEESLDFLGIALTIAENIRLLVLGPLFVGALAYGVTFLMPQRFESTALIKGEASTATLMTTTPILKVSISNLGYLKDLSESEAEDVVTELAKNVQTSVGRNDKLIRLVVASRSPEAAQRMANEILANVFAESKPKQTETKRLGTEKSLLEQQAQELMTATKTVQNLLKEASPTVNLGALAESVPVISSGLIKIHENLNEIDRKLQGVTAEDVLQAPTLPKRSVAPKKGLITILVTLGAGFVFLLLVFLKQACRSTATLALHQHRLSALKRRYGSGK